MERQYNVGEYIVLYDDKFEVILHGRIIEKDMLNKYVIVDREGNKHTITNKGNNIRDYQDYSDELFLMASSYSDSVNLCKDTLIKVLEDEFTKAPMIRESYYDSEKTINKGDEVIIYPVLEKKFHMLNDFKKGVVTDILNNHMDNNFNGFQHIPLYKVKTFDGCTFEITGTNWENSGYFIGKKDAFVAIIVDLINDNLQELEKIDKIRTELYSESKGSYRDERAMRLRIKYKDPFKINND